MNSSELKRLRRLRWVVRLVLTLGVAASVAANILHARPNPISQTIASWPPLALLLTVDLVSRVPVTHRLRAAVRILATATIAGIAAWVSYWHMAATASRFGESGSSAYLLPITVDGLVVVASVCLVEVTAKLVQLASPMEQAAQVVEKAAAALPVPVSPATVPAGPARERVPVRPVGRMGPQVTGPSKPSPLTGKVLLQEPPQV